MTTVDWIIVAFTLLLALQGYLRGFVVGALSLVGFAVGALIGTRVGPLLLARGDHSPYAPLFGLGGALLLGALFATVAESIARGARSIVRLPGFRLLDGLLGAVLTGCVALGICWIAGAIVVQAVGAGALRTDVQRSRILRELDDVLPPSGPILDALARIDPLPSVSGPAPDVAAPARGIVRAAGVRAAGRSVVKILGTACGLGIEGSGWVAGRDLVVTNAHVVAGESDTTVHIGGGGPGLPAEALVFDPHNDIAVLHVVGLDEPALSLAARPVAGASAAILGYPEDGGFNRQPGRLGATARTSTENAYGQGPTERSISSLRGLVRPGNSGGPMVDAAGQVVATVFAAITDAPRGQPGGFAVPDAVVAGELAKAHRARRFVSTDGCAG